MYQELKPADSTIKAVTGVSPSPESNQDMAKPIQSQDMIQMYAGVAAIVIVIIICVRESTNNAFSSEYSKCKTTLEKIQLFGDQVAGLSIQDKYRTLKYGEEPDEFLYRFQANSKDFEHALFYVHSSFLKLQPDRLNFMKMQGVFKNIKHRLKYEKGVVTDYLLQPNRGGYFRVSAEVDPRNGIVNFAIYLSTQEAIDAIKEKSAKRLKAAGNSQLPYGKGDDLSHLSDIPWHQ
jgi:hypothetical protein